MSEYGVPNKVLQADLVPDWSAAEVTTGVSVLNTINAAICMGTFNYRVPISRNWCKQHKYNFAV